MAYVDQGQLIKAQGLFEESSTAKAPLGSALRLDDGRVFRYCKMGAVAGVPGKVYQSPPAVANHLNQSVAAAAAVGATSVSCTLGATAVTANQYADGFLQINDANGEGYQYKIKSHAAADGSAAVTINLYDPIQVALTTSSEYTLVYHPCANVIVHPSPATSTMIGTPTIAITAEYYGWLQTWGPANVLIEGTPAVNSRLISAPNDDGALGIGVETDVLIGAGVMMGTAGVDTEYKPVFLTLFA